ncbi:MAG: hypothetical protein ABUL77_01105 [Bacteroidota bacterium]
MGVGLSGCGGSPASGTGGSSGSGGTASGGSGGTTGSGGSSASGGATTGTGGAGGAVGTGGGAPGGGAAGGGATGTGGGASGGSGGSGAVMGTGGGASGGAAGPCTASGIVVCDNFENGIVQWVKHPMSMTNVAIDNTRGHNSTSSIKVVSANAPFNHISTPPGSIPASKDFYVRAWAYFGKSTAQIMGHVAYIVGATSEDNSGVEVRFGSSSTFSSAPMAMLDLNIIGSGAEFTQFSNGDITGGNPSTTPGKSLVANQWYCLEAFFKGSTSEFQAWVDDVEVTNLHVTDFGGRRANWAPAYTLVKIGGQDFSGAIGTVWYDDVALGTSRIHCNQ